MKTIDETYKRFEQLKEKADIIKLIIYIRKKKVNFNNKKEVILSKTY